MSTRKVLGPGSWVLGLQKGPSGPESRGPRLARAWAQRRHIALGLALFAAGITIGCRQDMHDQPRLEPLEASGFFDDEQGSRTPVEGTVARGMLRADTALYRGVDAGGSPVTEIPVAVDLETLERGRFLFDGFCAPCHDRAGTGNGMVVQRGFKQPPSMHEERLREAPPGYLFGIISNGFGQMSSYAAQIAPEDRWAVVAYMRALQLSQNADVADLTAAERQRLTAERLREAASEQRGPRPDAEPQAERQAELVSAEDGEEPSTERPRQARPLHDGAGEDDH